MNYESILWLIPYVDGLRVSDGTWIHNEPQFLPIEKHKYNKIITITLPNEQMLIATQPDGTFIRILDTEQLFIMQGGKPVVIYQY